jgi:hypothetical protein
VRRAWILVAVLALALCAQGAAAQPDGPRCRALTILRYKGVIYFHYRLKVFERPALRARRGIGMERACDDTPDPGDPPPWDKVVVYALDGISPSRAIAPGRPQVVFYDIYRCTPRFGEARFLRCLRRR